MEKIMCCRRIFLGFVRCFSWISILHGFQVAAFTHDLLNPLNGGAEVWHQRDARVAIQPNQRLACEKRNIYFCEEPPETVPGDAKKTCNYRNVNYHEQVFRWVAGRGCLFYTPDFLYVAGNNTIDLSAACLYENLLAPCLEIPKEDGTCGCYPFDPGLEEVAGIVREAMVPSAQGRWERCFYAARDCCSHYMKDEPKTTDDVCEATFDGWTCWRQADAGVLAEEVCSEFAYSNSGPSCNHFSNKQCYENGTWEARTDYTTCSVSPRLLRRYRYHIAMLSFSIASCIPAVFIFFFYKRLRITRVILHRNLLIAIIVRNIFVIVSRSEVYIDELTNTGETVMAAHDLGCRLLAFAERFAGNGVFVCMLVEGVYLHRTIVTVFRQKLRIRLLYAVGFVIAFTPAIAWAWVMAVHNDHSCWIIYTVDHIQWILDAPRVAILLVNTGLFVDVVRVLLTKIRNTENSNQLSTAKATLFLMPLFGTQFLLTAFRPSTTNCFAEQIYYYIAYAVEGLQGFLVAMLYCYVNKEVHILIKSTYNKTENAVVSIIRGESSYPRRSAGPSTDRGITCSTALPSNQVDNSKEQYATLRPKLHVAEIISIQASERLAEILEPVYETIQNGVVNESYDSLERSDNDSGFIPNNNKVEEYYGFTNASSISIDCQDWIRCVSSPPSSVYNNSLTDYEVKYLEKKFPNHPKLPRIIRADPICSNYPERRVTPVLNENFKKAPAQKEEIKIAPEPETVPENQLTTEISNENEDDENMLEEIMQYMETTEKKAQLDPKSLCPNRKDDDKIVFVEE